MSFIFSLYVWVMWRRVIIIYKLYRSKVLKHSIFRPLKNIVTLNCQCNINSLSAEVVQSSKMLVGTHNIAKALFYSVLHYYYFGHVQCLSCIWYAQCSRSWLCFCLRILLLLLTSVAMVKVRHKTLNLYDKIKGLLGESCFTGCSTWS
jgi:hypothetical protein